MKGVVAGGFDRTALFENVGKDFDKLFGYNRQLSETFEYCNTMKNGKMTDKLRMQERELKAPEQNFAGEKKTTTDIHKHENVKAQTNINAKALSDTSIQQQAGESGLGSLFSVLPSAADISPSEEPQPKPVKKKKKKPRQRLS